MTFRVRLQAPSISYSFNEASLNYAGNTEPFANRLVGQGASLRSRTLPPFLSVAFKVGSGPRAVSVNGFDEESCPKAKGSASSESVRKDEAQFNAGISGVSDESTSAGGEERRGNQRQRGKRTRKNRRSRVRKGGSTQSKRNVSAGGGVDETFDSRASAFGSQESIELPDSSLTVPSSVQHNASLLSQASASSPSEFALQPQQPLYPFSRDRFAKSKIDARSSVSPQQASSSQAGRPKSSTSGWGLHQIPVSWQKLFSATMRAITEAATTCALVMHLLNPADAVLLTSHLTMMAAIELSAVAYIPDELQPRRAAACSAYIELLRRVLSKSSATSAAAEELRAAAELRSFQLLLEEIACIPPAKNGKSVQTSAFKIITQMRLCRIAFTKAHLLMSGLIPWRVKTEIPAQEPRKVVNACYGIAQILKLRLLGNSALRTWLYQCQQKSKVSIVFTPSVYKMRRYTLLEKFEDAVASVDRIIKASECSPVPVDLRQGAQQTSCPFQGSFTTKLGSLHPFDTRVHHNQRHVVGLHHSTSALSQPSTPCAVSPSQLELLSQLPAYASNHLETGSSVESHSSPLGAAQSVPYPQHLEHRNPSFVMQPSGRPSDQQILVHLQDEPQQFTPLQGHSSVSSASQSRAFEQLPSPPLHPSSSDSAAASDDFQLPSLSTHSETFQRAPPKPSTDSRSSLWLPELSSIWTPSADEAKIMNAQLPQASHSISMPYDPPSSKPAPPLRLPGESSIWEWTQEDQGEDRQTAPAGSAYSGSTAKQIHYMRTAFVDASISIPSLSTSGLEEASHLPVYPLSSQWAVQPSETSPGTQESTWESMFASSDSDPSSESSGSFGTESNLADPAFELGGWSVND
ncbi:hypothetical protein Efla_004005 [Eimeria flavescens]